MKRCLMVSGGRLSAEFAREFLKNRTYDLVIAVDAGLSVLETLGICPDAAVGDFDTYGRGRLEEYKKNHAVSLTIHRPEKDEADTELAFSEAFRRGCTHMDILGATGGRLDHELSNIHLLYQGMKLHLGRAEQDLPDSGRKLRKKDVSERRNLRKLYFVPAVYAGSEGHHPHGF